MTGNELMVAREHERLRSQIVILENDKEFPNRKSQIMISDEDCGIANCDIFKAASCASLKDLGKKRFVFSKMDFGAVEMPTRLEGMK